MSIANGRRLPAGTFHLDRDRMRQGWYSDKYFLNLATILRQLSDEGYTYAGHAPRDTGHDPSRLAVGDIEVEMQFFTRRAPCSVAAGVDNALAILSECTGYFESERWISTAQGLEVEAVQDGDLLQPWQPAIRAHGRYRDFAILETPMLGALARRTRIATNVYECVKASGGKLILFFPARFDIHETQAGDGYAYRIGVERYNVEHGSHVGPAVSTDAQGDWWGERGGGTILADTAESVLQFARIMPPETPRIALVDTNNDCVADSLNAARAMFAEHLKHLHAGDEAEARKYVLTGVRPDTGGTMRDVSVAPLGEPELDCGVNPRLVQAIRRALDDEGERIEVAEGERDLARRYFRGVRIAVTGGFNPERIALFERLGVPVDIYGVGSYLLRGPSNDFTADVVRVKLDGEWVDLAKIGRQRVENPDLKPVAMPLP
jgi:nicotinate phosphoribosyltransferase